MSGFEAGSFPFLGTFLFSLGPFLLLAILVFAVRRGDPDPTGRRAFSTYLCVVVFVSLFTVLFATFAAVNSLASLAFRDTSRSERGFVSPAPMLPPGFSSSGDPASGRASAEVILPPPEPAGVGPDSTISSMDEETRSRLRESTGPYDSGDSVTGDVDRGREYMEVHHGGGDDADDAHVRAAVRGGLIGLAALMILFFHARPARRLVDDDDFAGSPAWRTYLVYLYLTCFAALGIAAIAGAVALYGAFSAIAPDVANEFNDDARGDGVATLISSGFLALSALAVFGFHWRRAGGWSGPTVAGPATPAEPPATPPPPPEPEPVPAPAPEPELPPSPDPPALPPPPSEPPAPRGLLQRGLGRLRGGGAGEGTGRGSTGQPGSSS